MKNNKKRLSLRQKMYSIWKDVIKSYMSLVRKRELTALFKFIMLIIKLLVVIIKHK